MTTQLVPRSSFARTDGTTVTTALSHASLNRSLSRMRFLDLARRRDALSQSIIAIPKRVRPYDWRNGFASIRSATLKEMREAGLPAKT
jgi:hypothetical protein